MRRHYIIFTCFLFAVLLGTLSCRDIQNEGVEHAEVQIELAHRGGEGNEAMMRTNQEWMTGINTELAVFVETAAFTNNPNNLQGNTYKALVSNSAVTINLPYDIPLKLFLYRYSETLSLNAALSGTPDSFGESASFTLSYDIKNVPLTLTLRSNGTAGFTTNVTSLTTKESGTAASFTVVLAKKPKSDVSFSITSGDADSSEGILSPRSLIFTSANWNTAQTVTVTGKDDFMADGDQTYALTLALTSSDPDYNDIALTSSININVTNTDDETAGISVSNPSNNTSESGTSATFTVALNSQPTANVSIPLSVSDATEGSLGISSLTFTSANWNTAQTVTVTGVDDNVSDGDISYTVQLAKATSTDATYSAITATSVTLVNNDDESGLSGKLAQAYVSGATVFADKVIAGQSVGDYLLGTGELSTTSNASGDYALTLAPSYGTFVLVSSGGTFLNSGNQTVSAAPMFAPTPDVGQTVVNLTPLTTLVVSQPQLKTKLDVLGGWNGDIAHPNGTDGRLLRVAKTVEVFWRLLSGGANPLIPLSSNQLLALEVLASNFNRFSAANMTSLASLDNISLEAMGFILDNQTIMSNKTFSVTTRQSLLDATQSAIAAVAQIPGNSTVIESQITAGVEIAMDNSSIAFAQATDLSFGIQFAPTIQNLSLQRISLDNLTATVIATDDGGIANLAYGWSFTNTCAVGGIFNATVSCFTGAITFDTTTASSVTLTNFSDNVTGTLKVIVTDQGGAGVSTQSSISINPGDFIFVP